MKTIRILLAVLFLIVGAPLFADEHGADPGINRPYLDPDFAEWVRRFESPGREVFDQRDAIVTATGIRPGTRIADVGAGTGLFTLLFAKAVGARGKVYAVDISPSFVNNIGQRAHGAGFDNVTGLVSTQDDSKLPSGSVDIVFVCDTYHHFEKPRAMLDSIHRALGPAGTLVIVDYQRIEGESSAWILGHVRAGRNTVIREIEAAGFRLAGDEKFLKENFFLRFTRRD